jgi:hypothetical protein
MIPFLVGNITILMTGGGTGSLELSDIGFGFSSCTRLLKKI